MSGWINEDEPLPPQPDAQHRVTMSGMGLTIQGDIGGLQLGMERHVDATVDEEALNEILDGMTKAFWRQQAHVNLATALVEVTVRRNRLRELPQAERDYRQRRTQERERLEARFMIEHNASARRTAYTPGKAEHSRLVAFDEETRAELEKLKAEVAQKEYELPLYEKQVLRQRAILAGANKTDVIEGEPLAEAAE